MTQPEAKFKRKLNEAFDAVHADGWRAYVKAIAQNGVPDLHYQTIGGGPGVWVEAKVDGNPLSKTQLLTIGRMVDAGCTVKVVACPNWSTVDRKERTIRVSRVGRLGDGRHGAFVDQDWPFAHLPTLSFWTVLLAP